MPTDDIPFETILELGQRMKAAIPKHIWDRGYTYARDGRVARILSAQNTVFATIRGTHSYDVQIDVRLFPRAAFCTCPNAEPCKHMAAVFLSLFSRYESMDNFLTDRSPANHPTSPARPLLSPLDNIEKWQHYLDGAFQRGLPKQAIEWPTLFPVYLSQLSRNIFASVTTWPTDRKFLFETYYLVFLVNLVIRLGSSILDEAIGSILSMIGPAPSDLVFNERDKNELLSIANAARGWLAQTQTNECEIVLLYTAIWSTIFCELLPLEPELEALEELRANLGQESNAKTKRALGFASCHLLILGNSAAEARALYAAMPGQPIRNEHRLVSGMLDDIATVEPPALNELHAWLQLVTPQWPTDRQSVRRLSQLWFQVSREDALADECAFMLRQLLPDSLDAYSSFVLEREDYETWSQLQLAICVVPKEIDKETLKLVQKRAPHVLLPIYHQAVERFVQEKNRGSYTEAVRLLVKLAPLYKKLKRQSEWADFLEAFLARHHRRSALRDILERRRLIP